MSLEAECWKSLITRYGPPLEPENLDEDILKLAVTERRALKVIETRDGCGSGYVYFRRAQMDDAIRGLDELKCPYFCIVFPHPAEISDEEAKILYATMWEYWSEIRQYTDWLLHEARG